MTWLSQYQTNYNEAVQRVKLSKLYKQVQEKFLPNVRQRLLDVHNPKIPLFFNFMEFKNNLNNRHKSPGKLNLK